MPQRDRNKLDEKKNDSENMAKETDKLTRIRTNRYREDKIMFLCTRSKKKTHKVNVYKSIYIYIYLYYATLLGLKSHNRCKQAIRAADECEDFERE